MSSIASDAPGWWQLLPVATIPHPTDLCHECKHCRDFHGADGKCRVYEHNIPVGGYEGIDKENPDGVTLPSTGHYHRETCYCPGEKTWHVAGLPEGFVWDSLDETTWRDPGARKTKNGGYQWWIVRPDKKKK